MVTATGQRAVMTDVYKLTKNDFKGAILTNMGAEDEYGANFGVSDIAFDKSLLIFSIPNPRP